MLYTVATGAKREYGVITLQDGHQLPDVSVAAGFLKIRDEAGKREESEEVTSLIDRLRAYEAQAAADNRGLWDENAERIKTSYEIASVQAFFEEYKGRPMDGEFLSLDDLGQH